MAGEFIIVVVPLRCRCRKIIAEAWLAYSRALNYDERPDEIDMYTLHSRYVMETALDGC